MRPLPFILASTDHGTMIVNRLDYNMIPEGIYGVGYQLLNNASYEMNEIELVKKLLRTRREKIDGTIVALDCGANVGVHAIEMAREMQGWGTVLAIEPQERLFYALCGNIAISNLFNVWAINVLVGTENTFVNIPRADYTKPGSFGSLELKRRANTEFIGQSISYATKDMTYCQMTTIDKLRIPRLDFVKLDVEGMEMDALLGAQEMIDQFRPLMLIEAIKVDRQALSEFLDQKHYVKTIHGMNWVAFPEEANQRSI